MMDEDAAGRTQQADDIAEFYATFLMPALLVLPGVLPKDKRNEPPFSS